MSFRRGELAVKLGLCCIQVPISKNSKKIQMTVRGSPGSGQKDGATSPQARAAAFGDKLSQLENDMAEIRDGTMKDVLVKLQLLEDEIEEINRRFGTVDRTGNALDGLRVRVNCYEKDMADLRRQVEQDSTPLLSQNQQAGTFPIPMYSGERSSLSYLGF